ncbi:MAG: hypothetical protein J0M28_07245 [Thauera sp.]|nr:hypothetical protein [Thauera sp.]
MNKKLIFGLVASLVAAPSFATALCAGDGKDVPVKTATKFIATDFSQKCSANVISAYDEDNVGAWIVSASKKGKNYFMGHTNGGAAVPVKDASVTPGTDPTPATHLDAAKALGGGS